MCCDNSGASSGYYTKDGWVSLVDGKCPDCGEDTVDGETTEHCNYSSVECQTCGWAPCDQSC